MSTLLSMGEQGQAKGTGDSGAPPWLSSSVEWEHSAGAETCTSGAMSWSLQDPVPKTAGPHFRTCSGSPLLLPGVWDAADDGTEHEGRDEGEQRQVDEALDAVIAEARQCLHVVLSQQRRDTGRGNRDTESRAESVRWTGQASFSYSSLDALMPGWAEAPITY